MAESTSSIRNSEPQMKMGQYPLRGHSLKRKGIWTVILLAAYFIVMTFIITLERQALADSITQLEEIHEREGRQLSLNMSVSHVVLSVNENYFAPSVEETAKVLVIDLEVVLTGLKRMLHYYPAIGESEAALDQNINELIREPSRAVLAEIRGTLHRLTIDLDAIALDINNQKQKILSSYRNTFYRLTMEWFGFGIVGIAMLGSMILFFFRRLSDDISAVRVRAVAIVNGYRGDPLEVDRDDEVGSLMDAINDMQRNLRQQESEIEMTRQQRFHKEKMAAVGSLAAAVAHEINNPLSAIVGIAESITEEYHRQDCSSRNGACMPSLLLEHARRVMTITRQISEFSVPHSAEPELLDLNGLIRSTCNFVGFDRRFRLIEIELSLDDKISAIFVVADHLVQILMNLLINAADAIHEKLTLSSHSTEDDIKPHITVCTASHDSKIWITVHDSGVGIPAENLELVFNEYFTTKGKGRGSGIGLALCRSLIRQAGGDISIASQVGISTTISISFPIPGVIPLAGDYPAEH